VNRAAPRLRARVTSDFANALLNHLESEGMRIRSGELAFAAILWNNPESEGMKIRKP
jgi:hypothetical protein